MSSPKVGEGNLLSEGVTDNEMDFLAPPDKSSDNNNGENKQENEALFTPNSHFSQSVVSDNTQIRVIADDDQSVGT